jgi:hypothetical protein
MQWARYRCYAHAGHATDATPVLGTLQMRRPCWARYRRGARADQADARPGGGRRAGGQRGRAGGGQLPADAVASIVVRLGDERGVGQVRAVQRHNCCGEQAAVARLRAAGERSGSDHDSDVGTWAVPVGARAPPAGLLNQQQLYSAMPPDWPDLEGHTARVTPAHARSISLLVHHTHTDAASLQCSSGARRAASAQTRGAPHVRPRRGART